jgi:hypothetical protein
MCVGVWKDSLIARIGPAQHPGALKEPHVREFDIGGRFMKGWVMITSDGVARDERLDLWIQQAVEFVGTLPGK